MKLGFGNGDYFRILKNQLDRFTQKSIDRFSYRNAQVIEIHCAEENMLSYMINNNLDLEKFSYLSLHTPRFNYDVNEETRTLLDQVRGVVQKYSFQNVVVHPDTVLNWEILQEYSDLPISIENMDSIHRYGNSIDQLKAVLKETLFGVTLDLQHFYMLDPTMKLAQEMQHAFRDRINCYHISGYREEGTHYPLFKLDQDLIIESLVFPDIPIVIESTFDEWGEHEKEYDYIVERLT